MADFLAGRFTEYENRTLRYVSDFIDEARTSTIVQTKSSANDEKEQWMMSLPGFEKFYLGKVRDMFVCEKVVIIITTDRQSAFDRQLASVPCKGRVLNLLTHWWCQQSAHILPNYIMSCPHPNVTIGKRCTIFPVEFIMRGYITGSTSTSLWTNYNKGVRKYCGHDLPEGLVKNQKLAQNLLTPTTKSDEHDELISAEEIVATGLMTQDQWDTCAQYAHELFALGQAIAASKGLILVDTKYEFGIDVTDGTTILLVDEIHTPDSSRYWVADTYEARMATYQVRHY